MVLFKYTKLCSSILSAPILQHFAVRTATVFNKGLSKNEGYGSGSGRITVVFVFTFLVNISSVSAFFSRLLIPQWSSTGISNKNNFENTGKAKEIKNQITKTTGMTRLLYNPSLMRAGEISRESIFLLGLHTYNHNQQFIKPVRHILNV